MRWVLWVLALLPAGLWAAGGEVADLAAKIREAGLDPEECYRVREINFSREDVRIYLTEGYLILGKPVNGRRISAVFSADVEGGDGELLVMPPLRSERLSLARFAQMPNLNEHFRSMLMLFNDDTAEELTRLVQSKPRVRPSPEMGIVLDQRWSPVVNNLARSFGIRLIFEFLSKRPASQGFFYAGIRGKRLGNFDLIYDPMSAEQIQIGQVRFRDGRASFDIWTRFQSRSFRSGARDRVETGTPLSNYRIEATLEPNLQLRATTKATVTVRGERRELLFFDISPKMRVTEVLLDGEACEVWHRDSLRANLLRGRDNGLFLVIAPWPLEPGRSYDIEFRHEGKVVSEAGNGVYYVGSRGTWYPRHDLGFTHYDITFRYPAGLDLVFTGEILEDRTEGDWRITRRRTEHPIRLAGFNLGTYEHLKVDRSGYSIEVYANRQVEKALQPKQRIVFVPRPEPSLPIRRRLRRVPELFPVPVQVEWPDPTARLEPLASEIGDSLEFMASHFGPPPTRTLTVSPIPGSFGQGFPGLLYISTMTYLDPEQRPVAARDRYAQYFYSEILHAHETAHQWWGNVVAADGYEDEWLMEALANYSALLMLEKTQGAAALRMVLSQYRSNLLSRNEDGQTVESAGPISWGRRLNSSKSRAWRTITYEKGSWIIHMLRRRLGDERFLEMLGELCRRYRFLTVTTEEFRKLAAEFLPDASPDPTLENFFEHWVQGIGLPTLRFSHSVKGKAPRVRISGTVAQSGVADDFTIYVPVEIQFAGSEPIIRWIRTGDEPVPFDVTVRQRPAKVVFNPGDSVLASRR